MAKSNDKINISNFTSIIAIGFILFQTLGSIFVVFFWDIPSPQEKIEKNIEIHRLKNNE